ncbi:hypothetical protein H0X10_04245 [Candidatus Saccharibacteria bacterium]|nr:hypothetical protein [Candidatus Saccharibacteria bacterium]
MTLIKKALLLTSLITSLLIPAGLPTLASAAIDEEARNAACEGLGAAGSDCDKFAAEPINDIVATVVNILSFIVGAVAVIMIIVAGFKYVTSGGDSNSISGAKSTLLYAIVGLIIVAMAQFLVKFVFDRVTTDRPTTNNAQTGDTNSTSGAIQRE